jgi:hypothetical protein
MCIALMDEDCEHHSDSSQGMLYEMYHEYMRTDDELDNFTEWINQIHSSIKFTVDSNL